MTDDVSVQGVHRLARVTNEPTDNEGIVSWKALDKDEHTYITSFNLIT